MLHPPLRERRRRARDFRLSTTMPISPKRMPFMGHLNELRKRLTVVIAVVGVLDLLGYYFSDEIFRALVGPMTPYIGDMPFAFEILEAMTNRFRLGIFGALVVGSPVIIYEVLAFFLPALRPKERKWFGWTALTAGLLFIAGVLVCYFLVLGRTTEWLVAQGGDSFQLMLSAKSAMSFGMWFLAGFGMAFEVPVLVFYLVYFNVISYEQLRKNWRVVWIVIVVASAMITPDFSPYSMAVLAGAMIGLYELSMLLARVLLARKIREASLEIEDDEDDIVVAGEG